MAKLAALKVVESRNVFIGIIVPCIVL
jgi:hypothetical protein